MSLFLLGWLACVHRGDAIDIHPLREPWGQGIGDSKARLILEAGAADPDVAVRARALEALIRFDRAAGGGAWGPRARFDPSEFVQRAAIRALAGRSGDPAAEKLLENLAFDARVESTTRGLAAAALLSALGDGARHVTSLAPPFDAGSLGVLVAAARVGDPAVLAQVDHLLRTEDLPLDLSFWALLGDSGRSELADAIESALARMEPLARVPALVALFRVAPERGTRPLIDVVAGSDEEAAIEAIELLRMVPGASVEQVLDAAGPRVGAVAALARVAREGGPLGLLVRGIDAEDREERLAAIQACHDLMQRGVEIPGGARARLRLLLVDEDPGLQLRAAVALASTPGTDLEPLLNDESLLLRVVAASAQVRNRVQAIPPGG